MREALQVDPAAAAEFVGRNFGPPSVMAFRAGRCLHPDLPTTSAARDFIAAHPDDDIYFAMAERRDANVGKPTKADCVGSRWAWVDLDPPKGLSEPDALDEWRKGQLAALDESGLPRAPVVIGSGRGLWALWRLTRRVDADEAEAINRALAERLGADHCHNIDRVARVPFTRNSKTGAIAEVLRDEPDAIAPEALPRAKGQSGGSRELPSAPHIGERLNTLDDLNPYGVPDRVKAILNIGHHPDEPKDGDNSRSAWVFDAVCHLVRCAVPDETIMAVLTDPALGISASILDKGRNAERYAARQIGRARDYVAADAAEFQCKENSTTPYANQHNIRVALTKLGVTVSYDEFQDRHIVNGLPDFGDTLNDAAVTRLWLLTDERFGFRPAKDFYWDVVADTARKNAFHPVRDYLDELAWDGTPRLDGWLTTYGGAPDTRYTRAVGALMLVAAVRRVRQPGCKFDEMVVLESEQGKNKSSALAVMAVRDEWFTDDLPLNADSKVVIERLAGRWLVEAAELKGMRKGDVEGLKAFLSRQHDRARAAYARLPQEVARQCVIVGTTNSERYLKDGTGNRRFWPVRIEGFDLDALRRDRDQLWAEAAAREASGASIRLDRDLWAEAAEQQEARRVEDPYVVTLAAKLGEATGKLRATDAWDLLDIPAGQRTQEHNARLGDAMRELGWERTKLRFAKGAKPEWGYAKGTPEERQHRLDFWPASGGENDEVPF